MKSKFCIKKPNYVQHTQRYLEFCPLFVLFPCFSVSFCTLRTARTDTSQKFLWRPIYKIWQFRVQDFSRSPRHFTPGTSPGWQWDWSKWCILKLWEVLKRSSAHLNIFLKTSLLGVFPWHRASGALLGGVTKETEQGPALFCSHFRNRDLGVLVETAKWTKKKKTSMYFHSIPCLKNQQCKLCCRSEDESHRTVNRQCLTEWIESWNMKGEAFHSLNPENSSGTCHWGEHQHKEKLGT